jgi:integrase
LSVTFKQDPEHGRIGHGDELTPRQVIGITFHTLRHGAATLLLAGGVADAVAIKLMGHADTKILRRYQEVVDELQRDAAARMDALLG